jgi:hypothetical protein
MLFVCWSFRYQTNKLTAIAVEQNQLTVQIQPLTTTNNSHCRAVHISLLLQFTVTNTVKHKSLKLQQALCDPNVILRSVQLSVLAVQ